MFVTCSKTAWGQVIGDRGGFKTFNTFCIVSWHFNRLWAESLICKNVCQVLDKYKLLNNMWDWRMQERDISVFHIEELDCEIKHMVLQPCYFALHFLEFHCCGHIQFMKTPKETRNPLWQRQKANKRESYRKDVKECRSLVWLSKSPWEIQMLSQWHIGYCIFFLSSGRINIGNILLFNTRQKTFLNTCPPCLALAHWWHALPAKAVSGVPSRANCGVRQEIMGLICSKKGSG